MQSPMFVYSVGVHRLRVTLDLTEGKVQGRSADSST